mmetsp:Transcript_26930/g.81247  ORF Transcript_26930/g.81247 Transcript_26930/m.81247 type:complete len:292 (-) Transcript_26930:14-889(-)
MDAGEPFPRAQRQLQGLVGGNPPRVRRMRRLYHRRRLRCRSGTRRLRRGHHRDVDRREEGILLRGPGARMPRDRHDHRGSGGVRLRGGRPPAARRMAPRQARVVLQPQERGVHGLRCGMYVERVRGLLPRAHKVAGRARCRGGERQGRLPGRPREGRGSVPRRVLGVRLDGRLPGAIDCGYRFRLRQRVAHLAQQLVRPEEVLVLRRCRQGLRGGGHGPRAVACGPRQRHPSVRLPGPLGRLGESVVPREEDVVLRVRRPPVRGPLRRSGEVQQPQQVHRGGCDRAVRVRR